MAVSFDRENISSGYNLSKINTNFSRIEEALQDSISRSGVAPNTMEADLDLNNNSLLNVDTLQATTLIVDGLNLNNVVDEVTELRDETVEARDETLLARDEVEALADIISESPIVLADNTFSTIAQASAWSPEVAPDFIRTAGYSSAGDGGGGIYKKVASQPTHDGKFSITLQNSTVVWYELKETTITLEMFGGGIDKTGDANDAAYTSAEGFISTNPFNSGIGRGGGLIQFNYGTYSFSSTIQIKKVMILQGRTGSEASVPSTVLSFPADTTGIIIHRTNTLNDGTVSPGTGVGDGTIIRDLAIFSAGGDAGTVPDDNHGMLGHGIWMRSRAVLENLYIRGFPCHGLFIRASASTGTTTVVGNANNWRVTNCRFTGNEWCGMFTNGADANAGVATGIDSASNILWGIQDSSFLGNTYIGCHAATNGSLSRVYNNGFRYNYIGGDSTVEPGTDEDIWSSIGAGGVHSLYPQWVSTNTYARGGPYYVTGDSARNMLLNCYSESDQAYSEVTDPNMIIGGLHAAGFINTPALRVYGATIDGVETLTVRDSNVSVATSGITNGYTLTNQGSKTSGRGGRYSIYAGQNASDGSDRFAGSLYAKCLGAGDTVSTAVGLEYFDATNQVIANAVEYNGNTKSATPGVDSAWSWGTFALRWLKGWFGNISLFPASSVTPANNGEVTFQLTSDTSLTFKVKGSDGTVRSGSITLS